VANYLQNIYLIISCLPGQLILNLFFLPNFLRIFIYRNLFYDPKMLFLNGYSPDENSNFMKKIVLLLMFLYSSLFTFSQYSYYKKAQILKKDSTSLSGFIEKVSESSLNSMLKFKKNMEDPEPLIIPVSDVKMVGFIDDSLIFENVNYIYRKDSVKITEERLAKKMIEGYASLYKLQLHPEEISIIFEPNNTFVYVVKIDSNYYLLDQKERMDGTSYRLMKNYQGVLCYILRDYKDLSQQVKNLGFSDEQIAPLINKLNSYHSEVKSITQKVKKEKSRISYGPVVSYLDIHRFDGEFSGANIGYQLKIVYPNFSEKISTDFGVFFDRWYSSYFGKKSSYDFIRFYCGGTYRFNNRVISPFISGGLAYHAYLKYLDEFMASGTIGITFYKSLIVSATIERMTGSTKSQVAPPSHFFINLGYLFGKK